MTKSQHQNTILLTGKKLSITDLINIAENNYPVDFSPETKAKLQEYRQKLERQILENPDIAIYGVNRLHGDLKDIAVPIEQIRAYQIKYVKVHNCGTGKPLPISITRAMMVIRLNSFAKGMSGMKLNTCQLMLDMLNKQVTPYILEEGSVGASGDLVPLSMLAAVLIGLPEAQAYYNGMLLPATEALQQADLQVVTLGAKEAMGISNGANFIAAWAAFSVRDIEEILTTASISTALSLEAIRGEKRAFLKIINEKSDRHEGQVTIAQQIRTLLKNSQRTSIQAQTHQFNQQKFTERVQDRYSFRCSPQVHGAAFEALQKLKSVVEVEINSATDNPLFDFRESDPNTGGVLFASGGNFHGQPLATVIDYMKIALTSVGLMSDKRTFSMLDQRLSYGLPANLSYDPKQADAGLMLTQYAGAARAAENRILSTPASIMSVSTSANQEDFVSMGSLGVLHLQKIIYNMQILLAIELLCAMRALQLTDGEKWLPKELQQLGEGTQKVFDYLITVFPKHKNPDDYFYLKDHYLQTDMDKMIEVVKSGYLLGLI